MSRTTETADIAASGPVIPGVEAASRSLVGERPTVYQPSTGPVGAARTSDHQYSFSGVGPYPGVTGILDVLHKQALIPWAKRTVAEFAVSETMNGKLLEYLNSHGPADTAKHLASLPDYQRNTAASLGTAVHHLADLLGASEKPLEAFGISEQALPYARAAAAFLDDYGRSNIISSEKMVINFSEAYGGTYDFLLRLNGELWLCDWKSSKGIYPETALQLAAYQHAEYIMLPNDPQLYPMPEIQRCGVVHLAPTQYAKGYRFVEYQVRDVDYQAFLSARNLWEWRKEGRFQQRELTTVPTVSGIEE